MHWCKGFLDNWASRVKMDTMKSSQASFDKNKETSPSYKRHQQQAFWQILIPVLIVGFLVLAAGVVMVLSISGTDIGIDVSQWADTSLIWMILPVLFFAVLMVILLLGLIYLFARLLSILPTYTALVQNYANLISARVNLLMHKLTSPIITVESRKAGMHAFFEKIFCRSND